MRGELEKIKSDLEAGKKSPTPSLTEFLGWFDVQRRGYYKVRMIREELAYANLETVPDFEEAWWGATLQIKLRNRTSNAAAPPMEVAKSGIAVEPTSDGEEQSTIWVSREATYRISRLPAAKKDLTCCSSDEDIVSVTTKMMKGGFSQIPVMETQKRLSGMVTWQSIGMRRALDVDGSKAREFMEPAHEIDSSKSIFDAISTIVNNDYVLVRDEEKSISGIITASDLSLQFRDLTEPFLLLSEIENIIRNLIGKYFNVEEMRDVCDLSNKSPESITTVDDLQFGEYVRLLQNPDRWQKLNLKVDRAIFCSDLDRVREIRNAVMHFNPEGIEPKEISHLREFARMLQQIARITQAYQT